MVDRSSPIPLWAQLLSVLKQRIQNGEFQDRFPTDKELIASYEVSRQTVREAIRRLELDGMLIRQRGKGTKLLKTEFSQSLGTLYSLFDAIESNDAEQRSVVLTQEIVKHPRVARELQLDESSDLFLLKRIRLANDLPLAIDHAYLPAHLTRALLDVNFEHTGLYDELEKRSNISPTFGYEEIVPVVPTKDERDLLGITSKIGAFKIQRKSYTEKSPLEWRHTLIRGDRYSFTSSWNNSHMGREHQSIKLALIEKPMFDDQ